MTDPNRLLTKPAARPHARFAPTLYEVLTVFCLAAFALFVLTMAGWVIAEWTRADNDLSQTAASWLQAVGVPLAIVGTVWAARHQTQAQERTAAREAEDERTSAVQAREERRLAHLFEAHALLHATTRLVAAGLAEIGDSQMGSHNFPPAWELSASRRRQFAEMDMRDAPSSVKSWWSFTDDNFRFMDFEFGKLAVSQARLQAAPRDAFGGISVRITGPTNPEVFIRSVTPKVAEAGQAVKALAHAIENEMTKLNHVALDADANSAYEAFDRWSFMEPFLVFQKRVEAIKSRGP